MAYTLPRHITLMQPGLGRASPAMRIVQAWVDFTDGAGACSLRQRRTPKPLTARHVADVLQVRDPDLAGVVAVASHLSQEREERHTMAQSRILFRVLPEEREKGFGKIG